MNLIAETFEAFLVATLVGALVGFFAPMLFPFAFAAVVLLMISRWPSKARHDDDGQDGTNWQ